MKLIEANGKMFLVTLQDVNGIQYENLLKAFIR